jgi:hypothetical protein
MYRRRINQAMALSLFLCCANQYELSANYSALYSALLLYSAHPAYLQSPCRCLATSVFPSRLPATGALCGDRPIFFY